MSGLLSFVQGISGGNLLIYIIPVDNSAREVVLLQAKVLDPNERVQRQIVVFPKVAVF